METVPGQGLAQALCGAIRRAQDVNPTDTMLTFDDRMTLHLGGKTIELIYVDDRYNPGDVAVWLPDSGVLHAAFVGYVTRHPDIRPDYSHGTTSGMLKQLEALIALRAEGGRPRPRAARRRDRPAGAHRLSAVARQKVRAMMGRGLPLPEIENNST